jgi:dinuclear metal center YbgI/SA1388 family protein
MLIVSLNLRMKIKDIITCLESIAPAYWQESYDNTGLLTGDADWHCTGALITLDATEAVITEAIEKKCNLIIAHHPIIFSGLKKINGKNYVEKAIIAAIKSDIALFSIHTNLDNVQQGVNGIIADKLGLINKTILHPKTGSLKKLFTFVPKAGEEALQAAIFNAGAGFIGNYSECSFTVPGKGTFKAGHSANPFLGEIGKRHQEDEVKIEVVFPPHLEKQVIAAMKKAHPYEEVAYDIVALDNQHPQIGSGLIAELPHPMGENEFLQHIKRVFKVPVIRHTRLLQQPVSKIAICGGAGSFLISKALASGAQFFITSDIKYHEFFDANNVMVIADIGHFESEQFTIDLLLAILREKFPTFASLKTTVKTNPVYYFL